MSIDRNCRWLLGLGVVAATLAGCGGKNYTPPSPADPAVAQTALETALDCWRLQKSPEELRVADPPIAFSDFDWRDGRRLMEFQLLPGEEPAGPTIRWPVRLRLEQADGRAEVIDVVYIISTNPSTYIGRAD